MGEYPSRAVSTEHPVAHKLQLVPPKRQHIRPQRHAMKKPPPLQLPLPFLLRQPQPLHNLLSPKTPSNTAKVPYS